jgi:long-chain acyl-CoA synthetase
MITHANLVGAIAGLAGGVAGLTQEDVYLAYLPCSHVLELAAENCILSAGGALGYGSPLTLTESSRGIAQNRGVKGDAAMLKPTVMAAVPAVMDLIRDSILKKVSSSGFVKKTMFNVAMYMKTLAYKAGHDSPLFDLLVFDKLRTRVLGGRIRLMLSGGGPLSGATQLFMNVCFCCPVGQGYGLTETCGAGTIVWPDARAVGRVGPPVLCTDIKLVDWEEGGYTSKDEPRPRGEIAMAGANVTLGYFKRPEKTKEDFRADSEGRVWFHTGDIGELCTDGTIKIVDRKKDIVKLSRGEYVSLGKVESTLSSADEVSRLCVYANSLHSFCVAVVVPDLDVLSSKLGKAVTLESAQDDADVTESVLTAMKAAGKAAGLQTFEVPKKIVIADEEWTPDNEMVTAALKLKRNNIYKVYKPKLEALYE